MWLILYLHDVHLAMEGDCSEVRTAPHVELFCARETRFRRICPKTAQYEGVFRQRRGRVRLLRPRRPRLCYLKCIL